MARKSTSDPLTFPFENGDECLVRVRENGASGKIVAKFEAKCLNIEESPTGAPIATLSMPWGLGMQRIRIRPYEGEFEVLEDG